MTIHRLFTIITLAVFALSGCTLKTGGTWTRSDVITRDDGDAVDWPFEPDIPDEGIVPDIPDIPDSPDQPDRPDIPDVPDIPDTIEPDIDEDDIVLDEIEEVECTGPGECDDGDVCNGEETCNVEAGLCEDGTPPPDGTECGADPRSICLTEACVESICGDSFADEGAGEECDDGRNGNPFDGCKDDCSYTCHEDDGCDDDLDCTDNVCEPESHACAFPVSSPGTVCRPAANDCDSEEVCDGDNVTCPDDTFLELGTPCNDGDPCTDPDTCNETGVCQGTDVTELHDAATVSAGRTHTCAVFGSGGTMCWGQNNSGQLGDATTTDSPTPVHVSELSAGVADVAGGAWHTCALLETGAVKCWGSNANGQLGDSSGVNSSVPVDVWGMSSGAAAVSSGGYHACALMSAGNIMCWAHNGHGQLGNGSTMGSTVPVGVIGLESAVADVSAGYFHTCCVLATGEARCWGLNDGGQLGNGTTDNSSTPVTVSGLSSSVAAIASGYFHTCALLDSGPMRCWGSNSDGQLGNGTTTDSSVPVEVAGTLSEDVAGLTAGGYHTCVLLHTGEVKCWGRNRSGQLGNGSTTDSTTPVYVSGLPSAATAVSAHFNHTCAVLDTGEIVCWGYNEYGQVGDGSTDDKDAPVRVACE